MDKLIAFAKRLYERNKDPELYQVIQRAELCYYKWNDDSDFELLLQKCTNPYF